MYYIYIYYILNIMYYIYIYIYYTYIAAVVSDVPNIALYKTKGSRTNLK